MTFDYRNVSYDEAQSSSLMPRILLLRVVVWMECLFLTDYGVSSCLLVCSDVSDLEFLFQA